ncbi:glycine cleavage system aminomethyltransferase GcvT [Bacillus sp. FSL K6-3431]|uniref:glycine cleavage system aminomethyltransferase GcvT n=1 Tax=Bacillus sp. FSL K6-3431 TaxID=2921500 RepID=UPI0030F8165E
MSKLKRTSLFSVYQDYGAKTIDFGGWEMPVRFSGIKKEHEAVRKSAGLFDVSHMGELIITGKSSFAFLQKMLTNDLSILKKGKVLYSVMCDESGGVVDDLLIYQLSQEAYLLVVNAANTTKDLEWLQKHIIGEVQIKNVSDQYALLAIQGPEAENILQKLIVHTNLKEVNPFHFNEYVNINGSFGLVSRTGYTGEDGFEIYCSPAAAIKIWNDLLEAGKEQGLLPCGLGARDTLRFEAKLPLYGQEISSTITPLEAGLGFAVKLNKKEDFIGKSALEKQREHGIPRKIVGIEMIDRGIPRQGYQVFLADEEIGVVTSGTQSPTFKKNIGLGLIKSEICNIGTELEIEIRKKRLRAKIIATPFLKRSKN